MGPLLRVIINSDDFGWSSAVNDAVADAHQNGVLSSATIMANMPAFEEAVGMAKFLPRLGVGVHLNLLRGTPLANPARIRTLVGKDGRFLSSAAKLWLRFADGQANPAHAEEEFSLQMKRVADAGIKPTHIDSEKHLHILFPELWEIVCNIALRFGVKRVRTAREMFVPGLIRARPLQLAKALIVRYRNRGFSKIASRSGLSTTNNFFGIAHAGDMTAEVYEKLFASLPEGTTEIMCHPGTRAAKEGEVAASAWLDQSRVKEYLALTAPATRAALERSGAKLITFGDI